MPKRMQIIPSQINLYGDTGVFLAQGRGADIASQRADDLDMECIRFLVSKQRPVAVDVGCGAGGQAARMALAGASVLAIDGCDLSSEVRALAIASGVHSRVRFVQHDMRHLDSLRQQGMAHAVISQRALHYIKFPEAVEAVKAMGRMLRADGRLYISASGILSELGDGYPAGETALADRYCELAASMQEKHGIHGAVCLYSVNDMREMLHAAGMVVDVLYASAFGNIKAVAHAVGK